MSMKRVKIPWRAWYGDTDYKLTLPEEWDVEVLDHKGGRELRLKDIAAAIDAPIGTASLSDLADGGGTVTIAVDDLSRPTPGARLLPAIIGRLTAAGIQPQDIRIIMAVGAHRPCTGQDLSKKLGKSVLDSVSVENHHPYENLVDLGESSRGTPIRVNAPFMEGDLKLAVGCVIPHYGPGFGGGVSRTGMSSFRTSARSFGGSDWTLSSTLSCRAKGILSVFLQVTLLRRTRPALSLRGVFIRPRFPPGLT